MPLIPVLDQLRPPLPWRLIQQGSDGAMLLRLTDSGPRCNGLRAIYSTATEQDGRRWLHFSVSWRDRLPTWEELTLARDELLGPQTKAIQVLPPAQRARQHPPLLPAPVRLSEP